MLKKPLLLGAAILVTYLVAGGLYAGLTPKWQAPDEPAHYNYVHFLATQGELPRLVFGCYNQEYLSRLTSRRFPPELSINSLCYENHQPPLYYVLAAPLFTASGGSLLALRLFSVLLGGGVVVLAFFVGRTVFPDRPAIALGTMAFVAFVPMHVAILASVNNDSLAELILAGLLLLMARRLLGREQAGLKKNLLLGALLGLGLVTKTTVYIAVPLVAAALWLEQRGRPNPWGAPAKQLAVIYGLALIIALPWYLRNVTLYGGVDILGLGRHDDIVVGQLRTASLLAQVGGAAYAKQFIVTTFQSFWGQFGWMAVPMDNRTYLLLVILTLAALAGLAAFLLTTRLPPGQRNGLGLMGLAVLLMALAYGWYNFTFVQFQGRYLFPSLIPLGLFFSLGLAEALKQRRAGWLAGGLGLALIWVGVSSTLGGGLDKWAVLIIGLALGLSVARLWLARYRVGLTPWLLAACYAGLALLALVAPFWFVVPYL